MIKFLKRIFKKTLQKIDSKYEEKEKIREKERKLLRLRMAAYNLGTKSALKPKEVFWHITFPKILKFSMLGTKYSIIGIIAIGEIIGGILSSLRKFYLCNIFICSSSNHYNFYDFLNTIFLIISHGRICP